MLDPREVVEHKTEKDSSKNFCRKWESVWHYSNACFGYRDLVALVAIGTESFYPRTIIATLSIRYRLSSNDV
jgi:hypothetical protein